MIDLGIIGYVFLAFVVFGIIISLKIIYLRKGKEVQEKETEDEEHAKTDPKTQTDKPDPHDTHAKKPAVTTPKKGFSIWPFVSGLVVLMFCYWLFFVPSKEKEVVVKYQTTSSENSQEFPRSGQGYTTMNKPIQAYLNPLKTHIQVSGAGHTKFVLTTDTTIFYYCACKETGKISGNTEDWYCMPPGNYFIYPYKKDKVILSWWQ